MTARTLPLTRPQSGPARPLDVRRPLEALIGVPFTDGNAVDVLRNGTEVFPAVIAAIRGATRSVDMLWFLWGTGDVTGTVAAALAERARAGLRVRVLLDGFGAKGIDPDLVAGMRDAGCDVLFYSPLRGWRVTSLNMRTHRRVLVCDETLAITGGTGIDVAWTGDADDPAHWRDTAFRVRGPAVDGIRAAFASDWVQADRPLLGEPDTFPAQPVAGTTAVQVIRAGSQPGWNECALALLTFLHLARERVRVSTPYVRLPSRFRQELTAAAGRGLQVQLLVNGPHSDRRWVQMQGERDYAELLAGGVEIWQYQPTYTHAKVLTVDGQVAMVGSANLDVRSYALNQQNALVIDDRSVTGRLDADFDDDLAHAEQLSVRSWRSRGLRQRALATAADLVGRPLRGLGTDGLVGRRA